MPQLLSSQHLASNDRPVALRMRRDLLVRERSSRGRTYFILKDPITLAHHQLWEEEYSLLQMLDGKTSFSSMKEAFGKRFKNSRLDLKLLQMLHGQFHRNGLVLSDGVGQSGELHRRNERLRSQARWGRVRQWMSIRLRGINPDTVLEYLDRRIGWCFEAPALLAITGLIVFTLFFFILQGITRSSSLLNMNAYLTTHTVGWLLVTFLGLKFIHELGHGIACKHYGGECNEMGIMLIIFTPCLYCDVTDSWMIESKWKRAMIALAGIWFELITASLCMWIWWLSNPGIIHSVCFHAMLVGSIGTIAFNGNPLLKYDGYFVVSDLLDRPNLWQSSRRVVLNGFVRFYVRNVASSAMDYSGRGNGFLWFYGLLSGAYRWILFVVVLMIVYKCFQVFRLELLGLFLIVFALIGLLVSFFNRMVTFVGTHGRIRNLRKGRISLSVFIALSLLAAVVWIPLPARLHAPVFMEVKDAKSVVVMVDGKLLRCQPEGALVRSGDVIAVLDSHDLQLNLAARRGELARQRARLIGLESRRSDDVLIASRIPTVQETIIGLELEVERLASEQDQLTLRAPIDGIIIAPLRTDGPTTNDVPFWFGTPLDVENTGCFLRRGTLLCQIGQAGHVQGTVYLSQAQVELVRPGQAVTIKSKALPSASFRGTMVDVGSTGHPEIPLEIARSGLVPHRTNKEGRPESSEPIYVARVEIQNGSFEANEAVPMHHTIGAVHIQVDAQSIGTRLARFVYSTFSFDPTVQRKATP